MTLSLYHSNRCRSIQCCCCLIITIDTIVLRFISLMAWWTLYQQQSYLPLRHSCRHLADWPQAQVVEAAVLMRDTCESWALLRLPNVIVGRRYLTREPTSPRLTLCFTVRA